jgi:uncharacterized membrane protein SpoIIM required for sporulation
MLLLLLLMLLTLLLLLLLLLCQLLPLLLLLLLGLLVGAHMRQRNAQGPGFTSALRPLFGQRFQTKKACLAH